MSSEATPITPARFAEALKDLPASSLALKVLELRNSIAHLDYSNAELRPFAEGRQTALDSTGAAEGSQEPDQDCVEAIAENEGVIARMQERIELIKNEVESRGLSWREFQGKPDDPPENGDAGADADTPMTNGVANGDTAATAATNGEQQQHQAWRDGTFQTGTIRGLSDEELLRQLQQRMPPEDDEEGDDEEGGLHL